MGPFREVAFCNTVAVADCSHSIPFLATIFVVDIGNYCYVYYQMDTGENCNCFYLQKGEGQGHSGKNHTRVGLIQEPKTNSYVACHSLMVYIDSMISFSTIRNGTCTTVTKMLAVCIRY